jgi:hypothetical protein
MNFLDKSFRRHFSIVIHRYVCNSKTVTLERVNKINCNNNCNWLQLLTDAISKPKIKWCCLLYSYPTIDRKNIAVWVIIFLTAAPTKQHLFLRHINPARSISSFFLMAQLSEDPFEASLINSSVPKRGFTDHPLQRVTNLCWHGRKEQPSIHWRWSTAAKTMTTATKIW